MTAHLPKLQFLSIRIPVSDMSASRRWYCDIKHEVDESRSTVVAEP